VAISEPPVIITSAFRHKANIRGGCHARCCGVHRSAGSGQRVLGPQSAILNLKSSRQTMLMIEPGTKNGEIRRDTLLSSKLVIFSIWSNHPMHRPMDTPMRITIGNAVTSMGPRIGPAPCHAGGQCRLDGTGSSLRASLAAIVRLRYRKSRWSRPKRVRKGTEPYVFLSGPMPLFCPRGTLPTAVPTELPRGVKIPKPVYHDASTRHRSSLIKLFQTFYKPSQADNKPGKSQPPPCSSPGIVRITAPAAAI